MPRLVIAGGPLWTGRGGAVRDGLVAAKGGRVVYAGAEEGFAPLPGDERFDTRGGLILPGLVNSHCHAAMVLFRGLADDLPLEAWLNRHIWPAEARLVNPAMVEACTALAAAEMLLSGTTTAADSYFFMDAAARGYQAVGMRAVLAQGVIDFPTPDAPDPARAMEHTRSFLERWQGADPLLTPAVFAHSIYTCSAKTLRAAAETAAAHGAGLHIHLSESSFEVAESRRKHGASPVGYLEKLGLLGRLQAAVHCVHLEPGEAELLAERGVAIACCPQSNFKLASGLPDICALLQAGCKVGLGTDGAASNNDLDLLSEVRSAALSQKLLHADPAALPAWQALELALSGSAAALGLEGLVGALAPGHAADIVVLDGQSPRLAPMYDPASALCYAASACDVRQVWVNGRQVVRDGGLTGADLAGLRARVAALAAGAA